MASQEYRRIVKHWADWKLLHVLGEQYHLCRYDPHNREDYRATIMATDDKEALAQCAAIVKKVDGKE